MTKPSHSRDVHWKTANGLQIIARIWRVDPSKATILIVHGIGDHGGRFEHVAHHLNRAGYSVLAPDLRGNGRSEGQRGFVRRFDDLIEDINLAIQQAHRLLGESPLFLYGQSLGGLLVVYQAMVDQDSLSGIIASSPAIGVAMPAPYWKVALGKTIGAVYPKFSLHTGLDDTLLTDEQEFIDALRADPLRHKRITPRTYFGMLDAGTWCAGHSARLQVPSLLMHGQQDKITAPGETTSLAHSAGDSCSLKNWPQGLHELHNMSFRQDVLEHVVNWLDCH